MSMLGLLFFAVGWDYWGGCCGGRHADEAGIYAIASGDEASNGLYQQRIGKTTRAVTLFCDWWKGAEKVRRSNHVIGVRFVRIVNHRFTSA